MLDFFFSSKFMIVFALTVLWLWESYLPAAPGRIHRTWHAMRNLTLGGLNALLSAVLTAYLLVMVVEAAAAANFGLLRQLPASWPITMLALVLLDAWMYVWHRANHEWSLLWRFHRVHHCDPAMDVTTAVRFHAGEIVLSGLLRLLVVPLLGLSIEQVLLYDAVLLPVIFFHHSNIALPERVDRMLRLVLTTPALHRVHHSRLPVETNSNYSSIFSWWDRLARTFRLRRDRTPVAFGLDGFDSAAQQSLIGLCRMPFTSATSATRAWSLAAHVPAKQPRLP